MSFLSLDQQEKIAKYDPSILVVKNPRIGRWIVVQDTGKCRRPRWFETSENLIGIPGVGEKTQWKYLFRVEAKVGNLLVPVKANAEWIIKQLHERSRCALPDGSDFADIASGADKILESQKRSAFERGQEEGEYAYAVKTRRSWHYDGMTNHTGRLQ